jgi:glyoxylase-like metal-dependent hydrolase (beta-lactamase superfamily II)
MLKDEIDFYNQEGPGFFSMFGMPFPELSIDIPLDAGTWNVNGTELQVVHTPGHSPGSLCLYWPEKKAMACGDLVFEQSFGRVDFPGGDARKLIASINTIAAMDIEVLLPGHMNIIVGKDNVEKNFRALERYFSMI